MRETRNHLATITDADQVVGLITLNDVLQRLLSKEKSAASGP
jgi:CBS domain containing-hemolysin-like protein